MIDARAAGRKPGLQAAPNRLASRRPAGDPPFPDSFDSPTVVGFGPWPSFLDHSFSAF